MAKLHEIKAHIGNITGLTAMDESEGVSVLVCGDQPAMVPVIREKLVASGIRFEEKGGRKFKGRQFIVPLRNVGTAFNANWEFA